MSADLFTARQRWATQAIAACFLSLIGFVVSAQTPTPDQLNVFKSLPQDQQQELVQSVLGGKSDGTNRKIDPKLDTGDKNDQRDARQRELQNGADSVDRTADGRMLRRSREDPELRAFDSVLIDLTPYGMASKDSNLPTSAPQNPANSQPSLNPNSANSLRDLDSGDSTDKTKPDFGRIQPTDVPKTLEEVGARLLRDRILKGNPYKLNRFGVLEIPGMPAIPLAGLTADEATKRLSADPDLRPFTVKLTLLRLEPLNDESVKPFGYDLFEGAPSTFAPVKDIQVPIDYIVGPGDTINVQLFGTDAAAYTLTVGRDGRINFPKLGPILVGGLNFDSMRRLLEQRVAKQLVGTQMGLTMADLRSIRVFVMGEAQKPGSYNVSGLSTMTNALFVSGGVKKIGSLRNIQLKRNGRLVSALDLYDLLLHGDTSADRLLMPGDVIFIPPIAATISVYGAVRRPAIYELKSEKSVAQVVELAGGLEPDADGKLAQLERIQASRQREMININLQSSDAQTVRLSSGDILHVPTIRPTLENSVELSGYVFRPGAFEYHAGMRLTDVLGSFDELRPNADRHYVLIRRELPPGHLVSVLSADLENALAARGSAADPELRPRDKVIVFDLTGVRARIIAPINSDLQLQTSATVPWQTVSIDGQIRAPGQYPLEPGMRVSDLIRAGGSLTDSAFDGDAELTRYQVIDGKQRQTALLELNLAAIRRGDAGANPVLLPYDLLVIKKTPQWDPSGNIILTGEVRFPGTYPIQRGETLASALRRAGGLTDLAFPEIGRAHV